MKGKITISRDNNDTIRVRIRDSLSNIQFVEASMSAEVFTLAITGLAEQAVDIDVHGLANVGRQRVLERREILCPMKTYDRNVAEKWLVENAQEDGWFVNSYLGARVSIEYREDGALLHYSVTKYVDAEEAK